jgi:purine-binding chemotaxis protein CheW
MNLTTMNEVSQNQNEAALSKTTEAASGYQIPSMEAVISQIDREVQTTSPNFQGLAASSGKTSKSHASQSKFIIFSLGGSKYAVPIQQVLEVGEPQRITPVPNVPDWVLGVTNLRGDIISVVDCGAFLNLHEKASLTLSSMCVVRNKRQDMVTSLMVDNIEGMLNLEEQFIAQPEAAGNNQMLVFLQGIYEHGEQLLNVLNLEGLLSSMELSE